MRKTADERRGEILEAALTEFAEHGFEGASTDTIAKRAGISQPYLFRLFGTKKQLFIAAVNLAMTDALGRLRESAGDLRGAAAVDALIRTLRDWLRDDRRRLRVQAQFVAACADPEIREATRGGVADLVAFVSELGGAPDDVSRFVSSATLASSLAMMDLPDDTEPWASRLAQLGGGDA